MLDTSELITKLTALASDLDKMTAGPIKTEYSLGGHDAYKGAAKRIRELLAECLTRAS